MADFTPLRAALLAAASLGLLAACTTRTNVGATGAAPADVEHLWVTVQGVWFAAAADTPLESETGWTRRSLSNAVVLDLANVEPGTLVPLVTNLALPAGTYRQMHLELADAGDRLVEAARAVGLAHNAQVEVRGNDGSLDRAPLELPVPRAGLTLPVELSLRGDGQSGGTDDSGEVVNLAVTLDASRDLLTYEYGDSTGYILSPAAVVDDAAAAGEIRGRVDASALASGAAALFATAQATDGAGGRRVVVQRSRVATDGSFSLWPLPAAKNGATRYDVVISGPGVETVVVRDVSVAADVDATTLQAEPIVLEAAQTVYAAVAAGSTQLPAGTRVEFHQSLRDDAGRPYVIDGAALEPLTRQLPGAAFALSAGGLVVGRHDDGNPIAFRREAPSEGAGRYTVGSAGPYRRDTLSPGATGVSGDSDRPTPVVVPYPELVDGGRASRLTVNIQGPVGRYDRGFVAVMAGHRLVDTLAVDALLERGGGTVILDDLPGGRALAPEAGPAYRVAVRAWNSRNPAGTIARVAGGGSATLGETGGGVLLVQVP